MTKRKLTIPILLMLTLSILSQTLIPSPAGADSEPWIYIDSASIIDTNLTPGDTFTIDVKTNYTGNDIWGYDFTLTYDPLVLNITKNVTNGDVITRENVTFVAGTYDNTEGTLGLTSANSQNKTVSPPYPALNNTGPGILATVNFTVVGTGETPITLGPETKLKSVVNGTDIVNAWLFPDTIGHGYFRNMASVPAHDVATTGIAFHHSVPANTTYNTTQPLIYINTTIENQGDVPERFDVSVYYVIASFPTLVGSETITVASGSTGAVSVGLNTTGFPLGFLTFIVEASEVYNETQTNDNTYNTTLLIKFTGDIAGDPDPTDLGPPDGDVDWFDFGEFASAFGKIYPAAGYNEECDFDRNGDVLWFDFGDFATNFGKSVPPYAPL